MSDVLLASGPLFYVVFGQRNKCKLTEKKKRKKKRGNSLVHVRHSFRSFHLVHSYTVCGIDDMQSLKLQLLNILSGNN